MEMRFAIKLDFVNELELHEPVSSRQFQYKPAPYPVKRGDDNPAPHTPIIYWPIGQRWSTPIRRRTMESHFA